MTDSERRMRLPRLIWSWPGATILLLLLMLPIYGPLIPPFEGVLFPVTSKVEFVDVHPVEGGLSVRLKFKKLRDCDLQGYSLDDNGFPVDFYPIAQGNPIDLPTGERLSRPWFIGAPDTKGLRLRWVHHCPFSLWNITTVGYP